MSNHRNLLRLSVMTAVLVAIAGCSTKEGRIESGLKKGAEFVKAADWDKASVEARNVLQIDPKNAQAFLLAARVAEGQGNVQAAYGAYLKAVELQPELRDAQVGLARIYVLAGQADKADALIRSVLAAEPTHTGARAQAAALMLRRDKAAEAMIELKAIVEDQKSAPADASLLLAGLYAGQGKTSEALAVIDRALQTDPKSTSLLQVAAQVVGSAPKGDPSSARAADYFRRATLATPKNVEIWQSWARFHAQRNEPEKAEAVLREAARAQPKDSQRQIELFRFVAATRGFTAAEIEYLAAIKSEPREMALRFGLVQTYRQFNRSAEAQRVLAEIAEIKENPESALSAKGQLAAYSLQSGQIGEARRLVADVLSASPRDNDALVLRGRIHLIDNKPRDAVLDLRTALRDRPGSPQVAGLLAQAHRAAGEPQLSREALADAVKSRPNDADLRLLLAADMADSKDMKGAIAELDAAITVSPKVVRLYETKAKFQFATKDFAGAEKTLLSLRAQTPKEIGSHVLMGQMYAEQKRFDAALTEYDAAAKLAPVNLMPYASAVGLLIGQRRFDDATARVDAQLAKDPKNVLHHQLKGDTAMAKRDLVAAEQAYRDCIRLAPAASVGYVNVSRVLAIKGDVEGALVILKSGEQAAPHEAAIGLARGDLLSRLQRYDEAITVYEGLHKLDPSNDVVANNLAFLLAETKSDKASAERALQLASRFIDSRDPGQLDSLGWIHYRLGQYDRAVPLLERAVKQAPAEPLMQLHLGKALVKSGQLVRGKQYLQKAIDSKVKLPHLDEAHAMLAQG